MTRALVGYATRAGSTADVAAHLAEGLRSEGWQVDVANLADQPSPAGYDLVVFGSGIHASAWFSEGVAWAAQHAEALRERPVAVFNVCLSAVDPSVRAESLGYNKAVTARVTPIAETTFPGRYRPAEVGFFKRLLMRSINKPAQDHVDPEAIRAWARSLAARVVV